MRWTNLEYFSWPTGYLQFLAEKKSMVKTLPLPIGKKDRVIQVDAFPGNLLSIECIKMYCTYHNFFSFFSIYFSDLFVR